MPTVGSPKEIDSSDCNVEEQKVVEEDAEERVHFDPPLYHQRYMFAVRYLSSHEIKSVADMGCSDGNFFKMLTTVASLEQAALVDIDRALLDSRKRVINPELRHYVHRRGVPLTVSLYCGSAGELDSRLENFDAVTLIEVIEHLHPEVLEQVTANVFGNIQPKLCIVTTPNSEFNVLFGNDDPKQFRHWDHKFEWTRQEFQLWCHEVCEKYGYSVEHKGVGYPFSDPDSLALGPCSQAAIFSSLHQNVSDQQRQSPQSQPNTECYTLIATSEFPFEIDERPLEEKIDDQVKYCMNLLVSYGRKEVAFGDEITISVSDVANFSCVKKLCGVDAVRESLVRCGYYLSEDSEFIINLEDELSDYNDFDDSDQSVECEDCQNSERKPGTCESDSPSTDNTRLIKKNDDVQISTKGKDVSRSETKASDFQSVKSFSQSSYSLDQDDWDLEMEQDVKRLEDRKKSDVTCAEDCVVKEPS